MNSLPKLIAPVASSRLIALLFAAAITGCTTAPRYAVSVYYVDPVSRGTPAASMGVPVYYGLPPRPYMVLGVTFAPVRRGQLAEYVALRAKNAGGDAIIVLLSSPEYDGMAPIEVIRFKY